MVRAGRKHAVKIAIGAAAIGVATSVTAVAVTQPASIAAPLVDLAALIVVGSSTHPTGAGVEDFFPGASSATPSTPDPNGDDIIHVNFWEGPGGASRPRSTPMPASAMPVDRLGLGRGQREFAAARRGIRRDADNTWFILDNDVARPDGGFGTRYPWFTLIGVNPDSHSEPGTGRGGGWEHRLPIRLQLERTRRTC